MLSHHLRALLQKPSTIVPAQQSGQWFQVWKGRANRERAFWLVLYVTSKSELGGMTVQQIFEQTNSMQFCSFNLLEDTWTFVTDIVAFYWGHILSMYVKFLGFWTPSLPLVQISLNLSVLSYPKSAIYLIPLPPGTYVLNGCCPRNISGIIGCINFIII